MKKIAAGRFSERLASRSKGDSKDFQAGVKWANRQWKALLAEAYEPSNKPNLLKAVKMARGVLKDFKPGRQQEVAYELDRVITLHEGHNVKRLPGGQWVAR